MTYPNLSKEDNEKLIKIINDISKKHKTLNEKLIIMGDFNFPGIDWEFESTANVDESHIENEFLTCLHSNFLFQLIEKCTHFRGEQSPTLIDLLISNDPDVLNNISYNAPVGNSHHSVICFNVNIDIDQNVLKNQNYKTKFAYDKGNYSGIRNFMSEVDWSVHFNKNSDINTWKSNLENILSEACDKFVPKVKINQTNGKSKYKFQATGSLLELINGKRSAFSYYKYTIKDSQLIQILKTINIFVILLILRSKKLRLKRNSR